MAWTYNGPESSAKDVVRFYIGDTDPSDQLLQDGEIVFLLGQYNNAPLNAAIRCCEMIILKFSRKMDETAGPVKLMYSQKAVGYRKALADLKRRLSIEDATPYAGGISVSDKQSQDLNLDRVKPDFSKQMMDNEQIAPNTVVSPNDQFNTNTVLPGSD